MEKLYSRCIPLESKDQYTYIFKNTYVFITKAKKTSSLYAVAHSKFKDKI